MGFLYFPKLQTPTESEAASSGGYEENNQRTRRTLRRPHRVPVTLQQTVPARAPRPCRSLCLLLLPLLRGPGLMARTGKLQLTAQPWGGR